MQKRDIKLNNIYEQMDLKNMKDNYTGKRQIQQSNNQNFLNNILDQDDQMEKKIKKDTQLITQIIQKNELNEKKNELNEKKIDKVKNYDQINLKSPWMSKSTSKIKNPMLRLHNEIIEFFQFISPSEQQHMIRTEVVDRFTQLIKQSMPNCEVVTFGSTSTRLYLRNADIDLVIVNQEKSNTSLMQKTAKILFQNKDKYEQINIIKNAKVPIIKGVERISNMNFDISFNKLDGVKQISEVEKALQIYPEMKYLIMIIKLILRQRDLHETFTGGVGSFLLFCMILTYLRIVRKNLLDQEIIEQLPNLLLSDYLLKFMDFYAKFNVNNDMIIMQMGGDIVEKDRYDSNFSLISPQDPSHDIGKSSFKIKDIFSIFKNRFNFLTNCNFNENESILQYLVNPSGEDFNYLKG